MPETHLSEITGSQTFSQTPQLKGSVRISSQGKAGESENLPASRLGLPGLSALTVQALFPEKTTTRSKVRIAIPTGLPVDSFVFMFVIPPISLTRGVPLTIEIY
jgi:hypothetical protein